MSERGNNTSPIIPDPEKEEERNLTNVQVYMYPFISEHPPNSTKYRPMATAHFLVRQSVVRKSAEKLPLGYMKVAFRLAICGGGLDSTPSF